MPEGSTVIIAAEEWLPSLKARIESTGEVLAFGDDQTPRALEAILTRQPQLVVLERVFAATSRGAALLTRLKADPTLVDAEIRVVAHDSDYVRVARPAPIAAPGPAIAVQVTGPAIEIAAAPAPPLDRRGTRRAQRHPIAGKVEVLLDGNPALLVDLSHVGAQVVSVTILRPNQRVRVALPDEVGLIRFNGTVAWARFELPRTSTAPQYRAGIEFSDANRAAIDTFIGRHGDSGTP